MELSHIKLTLIGAGKMGGAMLVGWIEQGLSPQLTHVVDPGMPADMVALSKDKGFAMCESVAGIDQPHLLVVAVKPQMMDKVLPGLKPLVGPETVVVSVAAGTPVATFQSHFGPEAKVVRAMPNTPSQVGRGMTAACASEGVSDAMKAVVADLLGSMGAFCWVDEESKIDAVTAISGSGPAYVFHMVEALTKAAEELGLDEETAGLLARQTIVGAGELLHQSDLPAGQLRQNVTSPGGTTAAALAVLMDEKDGLASLMSKAAEAARDRSVELAQ